MSQYAEDHNLNQSREIEYHHQPRLNEVALKFLADLEKERQRLSEDFPILALLIEDTVDRVNSTGRIPGKEYYADVYRQKPLKITQKVFIPVKQYPKFNFTGKILGPKGNSLGRLQEETQCKIAIKGRNSMRDRVKEEELRNSGDPRFSHLHKDLFLEISTVATPAESYARVAYALAEIRKYLVPDKNDEVSHEQLRELMAIDPKLAKQGAGFNKSVFEKGMSGSSSSAPKYMNLIKRSQSQYDPDDLEDQDDHYEYSHSVERRSGTGDYEYMKARPYPTSTAHKRPPPPMYVSEMKRLREAPSKPHVPSSYKIINKYK